MRVEGHDVHLTIEGDTALAVTYLPYAKSIAGQLIRNGQSRAVRTVTPCAGVKIIVTIVNVEESTLHNAVTVGGKAGTDTTLYGYGRSHIKIVAEPSQTLFMESGVVDLGNMGTMNPARLLSCPVYYDLTTQAMADSETPKCLGEMNVKDLSSKPTKGYPFTSPAFTDPDTADGSSASVYMKKLTVGQVPASIYSGKMRLFVQAHYGKKLKESDLELYGGSYPMSLSITGTGTVSGTKMFALSCGLTGIYTDATKKHWLVQLDNGNSKVIITKLRATGAAEALRKFIMPGYDLDAVTKERVEAYILAYSAPDPDMSFSFNQAIPVDRGLSFGWHFNWSGSASDIVHVASTSTHYVSTHYSFSFGRNTAVYPDVVPPPGETEIARVERECAAEKARWNVTLATVGGGAWNNMKWGDVVAVPDYTAGNFSVMGFKFETTFGDAAPLYAFYTRDTLNVIRYTRTNSTSVSVQYELTSAPSYFYGSYKFGSGFTSTSMCGGILYGYADSGSATHKTRTSTPTIGGFSGGGADAVGESYFYNTTTTNIAMTPAPSNWIDNEYRGGGFADPPTNSVPICLTTNYSTATTYSANIHGCRHTPVPLNDGQLTLCGDESLPGIAAIYPDVIVTGTKISGTTSQSHESLFVMPFGDAEAVYTYLYLYNTVSGTSYGGTYTALGGYSYSTNLGYTNLRITGTLTVPAGDPAPYEQITRTSAATLLCNAGAMPVTPSGISAFFAGDPGGDPVHATWRTTVSAGQNAYLDGMWSPLSGFSSNVGAARAFVGWI